MKLVEAGRTDEACELTQWDATFVEQLKNKGWPVLKRYFRTEVRGLEGLPRTGGALVVSNHSGGSLTPDVVIFGSAFYDRFGYKRPLFTLAHNQVFVGPFKNLLGRLGVIHASRDNAAKALKSGGLVLVFPGGDYDAYRPTRGGNVIDFNGRKGYVRTALEAGAPIVPMVSIGGQETQLFLTRGTGLAKRLGLGRLRVGILPITVGFPFGVSAFIPPNVPLPAKIVTQVLPPIDVVGQFGEDPDFDVVDAYVRSVMQDALDDLGRERRLPFFG
ncbi:lysophospholipid acyltransferase family protein [Mycobacterium sp. 29Ha]|uniref:lysophospholipid acyltransferase family protein n=1 Tax=Mycobacterium sp. 29Ha TaxID=2939268 RepID=UPI00397790A1